MLIAVGLPYGEFVIKGTRLGLSSSTPAAFFLLFCLLVIVQPALGLLRRSWSFTRGELLLMTAMMMLATAIPSRGFTGPVMAAISSVLYYATPENNWAESLVPHIPTWMIVQDEVAIKQFYEGLPRGEAIPWAAWADPLIWWLLFIAAFYVVLTCGMVIPNHSSPEDYERLAALGVTSYGQMTAGSFMYIGPQGIVHGTTITLLNAGRRYLGLSPEEDLRGKVYVTSGLGGMSGAQAKAAVIAGAVGVIAEIDPNALRKRHEQGWLQEVATDLDGALKRIEQARAAKEPLSLGYLGNVVDLWERLASVRKSAEGRDALTFELCYVERTSSCNERKVVVVVPPLVALLPPRAEVALGAWRGICLLPLRDRRF